MKQKAHAKLHLLFPLKHGLIQYKTTKPSVVFFGVQPYPVFGWFRSFGAEKRNAKDPDSLIQFQVWTTDYRNRGTLRGRVDVPLYAVGRKGQREMQLLLKDVYRPKGESCAVGYLKLGSRGSPDKSRIKLRFGEPDKPAILVYLHCLNEHFGDFEGPFAPAAWCEKEGIPCVWTLGPILIPSV